MKLEILTDGRESSRRSSNWLRTGPHDTQEEAKGAVQPREQNTN